MSGFVSRMMKGRAQLRGKRSGVGTKDHITFHHLTLENHFFPLNIGFINLSRSSCVHHHAGVFFFFSHKRSGKREETTMSILKPDGELEEEKNKTFYGLMKKICIKLNRQDTEVLCLKKIPEGP